MIPGLGSLSNRIFLASALLAALSIGAALFFVRARLTTEAQQALDRDVLTAATIVDRQQAALFETFTRTATLLADQPRFKAALDTNDAPTVEPIAAEFQRQVGADVLVVEGRRGNHLARLGDDTYGVVRLVSVPVMVDQDRLGILTLGYRLDDRQAEDMKAMTGAEIAFVASGRVQASTLGPASYDLVPGGGIDGQSTRIHVGDTEYLTLSRALHPETAGRPASVVVMHSVTARMRTLAAIQTFLLALAAGSVLLAIGLSYAVARTVTRPLATITDHMRQVAASGDLTRRLALANDDGWYDEDARVLAGTFNSLTEAVTRFQREAAQRERLSSLGRLSTVIAHEVRNPLMIIKGSLRTLMRGGATTVDVNDAAADIDEEVARLDRLVHDVLDFARPIRFDCDPVDINGVCEDAIKAVSSGSGARPAYRAGPHLPAIVTDRERVRTVLINLLTNAQHAVAGLEPPRTGSVVMAATAAGHRIVITVADNGPGIAPDDAPRIFDPYFTTRRGGTGLGLAISRNIVEGLGGTLTVTSRPGEGTEFRLELGDAPATT